MHQPKVNSGIHWPGILLICLSGIAFTLFILTFRLHALLFAAGFMCMGITTVRLLPPDLLIRKMVFSGSKLGLGKPTRLDYALQIASIIFMLAGFLALVTR